jgi:hypothetical protein
MQIVGRPANLARAWVMLLAASLSAYANNSRTISFPCAMMVNATAIPAGSYKARWEFHGSSATVTFSKGHRVIAAAEGRLVSYEAKFSNEAIVYETNADGSHTLLEIRFGGLREGIVLCDFRQAAPGITRRGNAVACGIPSMPMVQAASRKIRNIVSHTFITTCASSFCKMIFRRLQRQENFVCAVSSFTSLTGWSYISAG